MIWIIILIIISTICILYYFDEKTKNYIQGNYSELIVSIAIVILSVFIGSYLALKNTTDTNKKNTITNYMSMLNSCKKMEKQYMDNANEIINSLNSNSQNYSQMNRLIKNIDKPFLFEELLRRSDLYNCASNDFKSWLPSIISFFQTTDWAISKDNIKTYNFNYQYLTYVYDLVLNEEKFINNNLSQEELHRINSFLRKALNDSTYNINPNDIVIDHIKTYLNDSTTREEKYWKVDTLSQDIRLFY